MPVISAGLVCRGNFFQKNTTFSVVYVSINIIALLVSAVARVRQHVSYTLRRVIKYFNF